ncbi:MAG: hypothetical protein H0W29_09840 [Gemmatimonadales bacterium]|nr:hypothetical protein [Gemmatimonadales bacterium]
MRPMVVVGIILLALGGFIVFRGLSYSSDRSVLKVGDLEASVEERRSVPVWAGGLAAAAGLVLIAAGARRRGG